MLHIMLSSSIYVASKSANMSTDISDVIRPQNQPKHQQRYPDSIDLTKSNQLDRPTRPTWLDPTLLLETQLNLNNVVCMLDFV